MDDKKIPTMDKKCNHCDYATFSLRVLYKHRQRCKGKLLGSPQKCGYCKRKFIFPFLLTQHRKTCVKRNKKISNLRIKNKKAKLVNGYLENKKSVKETKPSTIVCPICMTFFKSRSLYDLHEASACCKPKTQVKKESPSARKSIQKAPHYKKRKYSSESSDSDSSLLSDSLLSDIVERNRKFMKSSRGYSCIRCKKAYPAKTILLKHLDSNYKCALAHFEQDFFQKKFAKARKSTTSVVARKSFSKSHRNSYQLNKSSSPIGASARKSLPGSSQKLQFKSKSTDQSLLKTANQCPVCHEKFSDSFDFYQHQKQYHHWGKAAKTINLSCKCPFCHKEFFSVRARNAHIRNHADQSDQKIEAFLRKTTCNICSQVFVSETLKLQHFKIEHSRRQDSTIISDSTDIFKNDASKYLPLPFVIKQKLNQYPHKCPICNEEFKLATLRNNHFEEIHLNSEKACQFCPITFVTEDLVDDHMKKFHFDQFKYECFVCKDKFPSVSHVVTHVKKLHPAHDPKNKQQSAIKSFSQQNLRVISDIKKAQTKVLQDQGYFCDICNLTFPKLQFLRRHEQSQQHCDTLIKNLDAVHQSLSTLPPSQNPVLPKTIATPTSISCSECFEEFSTLKDFVPHRLGHFGEKEKYMEIDEENTYTCEICGDVSDSHSKVQVHLFWHLQVESSSREKKFTGVSQNTILGGRSSNQHVAKKSFGKQTQKTHQEVVIGGIRKHLFMCDLCKIGFTDETHYNLHVRKFCRMKNNSLSDKSNKVNNVGSPKSNSALISSNLNKSRESEIVSVEIALCNLCCSIFNKSIKHVHDEICSKCKRSHLEPSSNIIGFKTSIKMRKAMAACLKCDCLFLTSQKFSDHMLSIHGLPEANEVSLEKEILMDVVEEIPENKEILGNDTSEASSIEIKETFTVEENDTTINAENQLPMTEENEIQMNEESEIPMSDENTLVLGGDFVIHCTTCNFIFFSTDTLSEHEKTCTNFSYSNSRLENYTPEFKAALEENGIISSCLHCDLAFNNTQDLTEHLEFHQKDSAAVEQGDSEVVVIDESSVHSEKIDTAETVSVPTNEVSDTTPAAQDVSNTVPNAQAGSLMNNKEISQVPSDAPTESMSSTKADDIDSLRKNFSQLLSILVSDPDLMQQLGYGELLVDEVLVKVLQTMEQTPVLKDEKTTELECLRKNIQILLDFCLEDQIMALIGDGTTSTDDIVVEALKIFGGESSMSIIALE